MINDTEDPETKSKEETRNKQSKAHTHTKPHTTKTNTHENKQKTPYTHQKQTKQKTKKQTKKQTKIKIRTLKAKQKNEGCANGTAPSPAKTGNETRHFGMISFSCFVDCTRYVPRNEVNNFINSF